MTITGILRGFGSGTAWIYRALFWLLTIAVFIVALTMLVLRYWLLPNIENYRESIAQAVSKAAGQQVTIGQIAASWDGLQPQLKLAQVTLRDKNGRPALALDRVDSTISWLTLPTLSLKFHSLDFYNPQLSIRRDKNGLISVAGIEMEGERTEGGFTDWLLTQRDVEIHNGTIDWADELRAAPVLALRGVHIHMVNSGKRHRLGLKATPPAELASPVDVRADLSGASFSQILDWSGRLFVQLDYVDIAAWRRWVALPIEIPRGAGALRAWVTVEDRELREMTADVRLANVRTRLGKELAELDLASLNGRIGWKYSAKGFEVSTSQLALVTSGNLTLQPMNFMLRVANDKNGKPASGEVQASSVDLAPLGALLDHLPLDAAIRKRVAELSPSGRLLDVQAKWKGELPDPPEYNARGRFEEFAVNRYGVLPGLKGISGSVEANQKGGTAQFASRSTHIDLPEVFREPLNFDTLTAQANWARSDTGFELKISNAAYTNPDLSGTISGSYRGVHGQPGIVDITGNLNRADVRQVNRYLPITVAKNSRAWIDAAFLGGSSNDVSFRVKGDLKDFPFPDNKGGTFFVTAKVAGAKLHYAEGWPDIENIDGDLSFRGKRMDIVAQRGSVYGVKLSKVRAEIADLKYAEQVLSINGEAEGATSDFFKFIHDSPVSGYIEHFTDGMRADGSGKLTLKLDLPLAKLDRAKIAGAYELLTNRLVVDPTMPALDQATGRVEFTESGVNIPGVNAQFFGGPIAISGSTQRDSTIRIALQGRVNPDAVRRAGGPAWLSYVRGSADWSGSLTLRKKTADLVLESSLQGLASNLPAPFVKAAAESVPLRVERRFISNDRDQLALTYGDVISARAIRQSEPKRTVIERAVVRLGGGAAGELDRPGVWVSGALKTANLDGWLKFAGGGGGDLSYTLGGVDVKFGELDVFDRKFHDLAIVTTRQGSSTQYVINGRELEGRGAWSPEGKGRLTAELKKLVIPAATPVPEPAEKPAVAAESPELPALNIVAENFQMGTKQLGKLELRASPQQRDWRIELLRLSNSDAVLTVDGVWQSWLDNPRTSVNVRWDVLNIGNLLTRMGYPEGIRRGSATLGGSLSWAGGPQQFDFPSLTGNFVVQAVKGQFLKMEPGIAKLLGIVSLQALPRRLTLDFRDIFSEGFAFDEMLGAIKVDRGIMTTESFRISGPSARVVMTGSVDIARETQNLRVKVNPHLSDGVSVATALFGGPIIGLAAFIAQKVFKDPLDAIVSINYNVTGTWAEPVVTRVDPPQVVSPPD